MMQFELKPSTWPRELNDLLTHREQILPACEIVDSDTSFTVSLDVPGLKKEDLELELKDHHLFITGTRKAPERNEKEKVLRQERRFGKFNRTFSLPDGIDEQNVTANFNDGVLEIKLPKLAVVGRKIAIN
ncbi:MAG: Hsp20/alpha crystallin family protein [Bacteriovoracaceae bacterium]|nr:Hsp20/alpha crystallin family protein [Bacteriovoracaceae bacterium]